MSVGRNEFRGLRTLLVVAVSVAALAAATDTAIAQTSEIDSYDRAVTSQTKENALAFLEEFRSSHLVGDLIESLRPEVAREVCADLPSGVSRARRACEQLQQRPVAEAAATAGNAAGTKAPPSASAPAKQSQPAFPSSGTGANVGAVGMSASATAQPALASSGTAAAVPMQPLGMQPATAFAPTPATAAAGSPAVALDVIEPAAGGQSGDGSAATSTVTPTQTAGGVPGFRIQFLAAKSRAEAESVWQELQMAYPDLLRDLSFTVSGADLGTTAGGVVYRGVAGPLPSRDEAEVLCIVLRSSPPHNDCVVAGY
jgi:SPOR domain